MVNSTVQYSTLQYSTVQYSTVQSSTVQYSKVQNSTVHCEFDKNYSIWVKIIKFKGKGYLCESGMALYKWKVTWNFNNSIFNIL